MLLNCLTMASLSPRPNRPSVSSQNSRLLTMSNGASGSALRACSASASVVMPTPLGPETMTLLDSIRVRMVHSSSNFSAQPTSLKFFRLASFSLPVIRKLSAICGFP